MDQPHLEACRSRIWAGEALPRGPIGTSRVPPVSHCSLIEFQGRTPAQQHLHWWQDICVQRREIIQQLALEPCSPLKRVSIFWASPHINRASRASQENRAPLPCSCNGACEHQRTTGLCHGSTWAQGLRAGMAPRLGVPHSTGPDTHAV
jgi:hypothetical protein